MKPYRILLLAGLSAGFSATFALADSISPTSFSDTLAVGESVTITKTVTVSAGPASSSQVDVYFLADTTGSMGSYINAVKSNAISIMNAVAGAGDVAFAVGNYQDYPIHPYGGATDIPYELDQALTTNTTLAAAGINAWNLGWGNDLPESQFAALEALSGSQAGAVGWRAGSEKIVVWFGDARGNDSDTDGAYPGPGKAETIASLQALGIQVLAVNIAGSGGGIDGLSQASQIAAATGGSLYNNTSTGAIASVITSAISSAVDTYTSVGLDLSEVTPGVTVTAAPPVFSGLYDRSVERTFTFDVTFVGDAVGVYDFNIYATVDGGRVATESDHIVVAAAGVPESATTVVLLGLGLTGLVGFARLRR